MKTALHSQWMTLTSVPEMTNHFRSLFYTPVTKNQTQTFTSRSLVRSIYSRKQNIKDNCDTKRFLDLRSQGPYHYIKLHLEYYLIYFVLERPLLDLQGVVVKPIDFSSLTLPVIESHEVIKGSFLLLIYVQILYLMKRIKLLIEIRRNLVKKRYFGVYKYFVK